MTITVRIDLQLRCEIEARWATQQSAAGLMNSLNPALQAARKHLAGVSEGQPALPAAENVSPLLGEFLALLNDPHQFADELRGRV